MIDVTLTLIGIVILFALFILVRSISSLKVCALCNAVFVTWITLLILLYLDYKINLVFTGLLMGGSIVGVMYLLEQKISKKYQLFKLPFFVTLVSLAYFFLEKNIFIGPIIITLLLWLIITLIHKGKNIKSFQVLGRKIIECCKNW